MVMGSAGFMAGNHIDLGPAFSLRLLRRVKPVLSIGIEGATGIAQETPVTAVVSPAFGPAPAPSNERLQFLDAVAIVGSDHGPYAIVGAGVYDRVTSMPGNSAPDPRVRHRVDPGFSGGVGYAGGSRVAPMVEYRVHIHGREHSSGPGSTGSTLDALWIGSAGLAVRF